MRCSGGWNGKLRYLGTSLGSLNCGGSAENGVDDLQAFKVFIKNILF